jgi:negative regulator of flagellin synthesis FlgM
MKIDPTIKITPAHAIGDERTVASKQPQAAPKAREDVQLSPLSAQLKEIEARLESQQAVDSARVAEVKRAIAEGSFAVDSEKVADRLIDATREFLRAQKQ